MSYVTEPDPLARRTPRSGSRLWKGGTVLAVASLVVIVIAIAQVAVAAAASGFDAFGSEIRPTPVDAAIEFERGTYTVFERVEDAALLRDDPYPGTITWDRVSVTDPDGRGVAREPTEPSTTRVTRGGEVYVDTVSFEVTNPGVHSVAISSEAETAVFLALDPADRFRPVLSWLVAALVAVPLFLAGVVLVIVGVVRRQSTA